MAALVSTIDARLEQYYTAKGRKDYKNDNGTGKFYQWADENGWDDDDIEEDLNENYDNPEESIFYKLYEEMDFPLSSDLYIGDDSDRTKAICDLLKNIVNTNHAIELSIPEEQVQEIGDIVYKKQLSSLSSLLGINDQHLLYFFAVGYMNNIPLLTWLVDAYTMDETKNYINKPIAQWRLNSFNVSMWAHQNKFMTNLRKKTKDKMNLCASLEGAMKSYMMRLLPRLTYSSFFKIDDDIKEVVDCVCAVPDLLHHVIANASKANTVIVPFSVDVCFAIRGVQNNQTSIDLIEDYDYDFNKDLIGDFKQRLIANKRSYASTQHVVGQSNDFASFLRMVYDTFVETLRDTGEYDMKSFPRNKRFGIFVDRRQSNHKDRKNEVSFFQQLPPFDAIPGDHVDEWYFEALRKCLIPGTGTNDDRITALSNLNGQLLTFSFHIEAADAIKCYIIWNGQTTRFKGDNLGALLSKCYFVKDESKKREKEV
eukprot:332844_1